MSILLDTHTAAELANRLSTLEDWLLHAEPWILTELADFAFRCTYQPQAALDALIDDLGHYSILLRRTTTTTDKEDPA